MIGEMLDKLTALRRGREVISNPNAWVKGQYTVNQLYHDVPAIEASRFCSVGALWRVEAEYGSTPQVRHMIAKARDALDAQVPEGMFPRSESGIIRYNDHSSVTHEEVLAIWDRAIAVAEEEVSGAPLPEIEVPEVSEVRRETVLTG